MWKNIKRMARAVLKRLRSLTPKKPATFVCSTDLTKLAKAVRREFADATVEWTRLMHDRTALTSWSRDRIAAAIAAETARRIVKRLTSELIQLEHEFLYGKPASYVGEGLLQSRRSILG